MDKLKPCPFCGYAEAHLNSSGCVCCGICGATAATIAVWNTRSCGTARPTRKDRPMELILKPKQSGKTSLLIEMCQKEGRLYCLCQSTRSPTHFSRI